MSNLKLSKVQKGDLSKARRLLILLESAISLVQDETVFTSISYKELEAIELGLVRSIQATTNLLNSLGDDRGMAVTYKLGRRSKRDEHGAR